MTRGFSHSEVNGGRAIFGPAVELVLNQRKAGYSNSQIDDTSSLKRRQYLWHPGTRLKLEAKFSDNTRQIRGTSGFGFWNAPFGDPSLLWPALPRAAWFFFASEPSDLPIPVSGPGRGWFASTIDATSLVAKVLVGILPAAVLLNNAGRIRKRLWPWLRFKFKITHQQILTGIDHWHLYELVWKQSHCQFSIDRKIVHESNMSPRGPMGFVAWMDNQFLVATATGRLRWGTISLPQKQSLFIREIELASFDSQ